MSLRLLVYAQGRSLFIDEASLGLNLCERTPGQWLQPLDYRQFAPPLWVLLQLLVVQLLGCSDFVLRLLPMLCGLATLPVFYLLLRRFLPQGPVLLVSLLIFSAEMFFVQYATELKQYSADMLVALLLAYWATGTQPRRWHMALLLPLAVWASMPAVFVLAAWLAQDLLKAAKGVPSTLWHVLWPWLPVFASFGAYYFLLLRESTQLTFLKEFHAAYYFPLGLDADALLRAAGLLLQLPAYTAGHGLLLTLLGLVGLLSGLWVATRDMLHRPTMVLWLPAILCYGASAIQQYSLLPRMLLWLFPLLMVLQALGWQWLWVHRPVQMKVENRFWGQVAAIGCLLFWASCFWTAVSQPLQFEELKPLLPKMHLRHQPAEPVVVSHDAHTTFRFYYQYQKLLQLAGSPPIYYLDWNPEVNVPRMQAALPSGTRFWLIQSHIPTDSEAYRLHIRDFDFLLKSSTLLQVYEEKAARIYYLEKK